MYRKYIYYIISSLVLTNISNGQVSFSSSNLPIMVINTHGQTIPDEPKITAIMGIVDNGPGNRNYLTDQFNGFNGKIGIEIRGHSSQMFDKKQYGIELRDKDGNDLDASLLGLPAESDWVLNASYIDKSLIRNVLTYKLANDMGRYASRTRFFELVINGEYRGIYILQEKIKRGKNRVDIKKMNTSNNSGDALTGGYIVKIDRVDPGDKYWTSPYASILGSSKSPVTYIYEYPKADDITIQQQNYIKDYITLFETLMNSNFFRDPFAGYHSIIDLDSFVDYFLINEFSKNTDAYRLSTFLYKNRDSEGGKLVMGPIWDYDISFGLADYGDGYKPEGWQAYMHYDGLWSSPFWTTNLINETVFKNKLAKRWYELKTTILSTTSIFKFIDEVVVLTAEGRQRNFEKWKDLFNPAVYTWPNKNRFSNYQEEINYLKNWITQRSNWLSANLSSQYSDVEWLSPDLSKVTFEIGKQKKLPLSNFVKNKINISSIEFLCLTENLEINLTADTLSLRVKQAGNYLMKGVGKNQNGIFSVSPDYKFNVNPTSIESDVTDVKPSYILYQNYPNPFNPSTVICFNLPSSSHATLKVYDLLGNEITTLVSETLNPGMHSREFTSDMYSLTSGVYFYEIKIGNYTDRKKMIFLK